MKNIILQKRMRGLHSWISSSCLFSSRLTGLSTNGFKRKLVSSFTLLLFLALGNASWAQIDFKQFANKPQESWINGILNPNNSVYFESTSTLQRVCLTGITTTNGNEHVMTLGHLAIKGNHHAYDFITSYDRALLDYALTTGAPFTGLTVDGEAIGPPFDSAFILGLYNGPNKIVAQPVASGNYASILGDNVGLRVAAYDAVVGAGDPVAGALKRGIQLYGNQPITAASLVFTGYDAQNYANYELHWTSTSTNILMLFGGHLALGSDYPGFPLINYGPGKGAADISGGPYHFKLFLLDGASLGNQDNQIQSNTIIAPPPPCTIAPSIITICQGATPNPTFSGPAGMTTYAWSISPPATLLNATTQTVTVSNPGPGTYTLTLVTTLNGATSVGPCNATLVVNPNPACSITGNDTICAGSTTQFCATAGMATYAWTGPGGFTASTACITIGTAGQYNVTITDANGCHSNCSRTLIVNPNPTCAITGNDTICAGSTTQFCATPGMASYAWTGPGGFTASTACITIGTAGQYNVTITDGNGCYSNCSRTLIVNPNPTCAITGNDTICTGSTTQFCATPGMATYAWTGPGGFTASTACITIGTAGQYNVTITDANGCHSNCSRTLIVNPNPTCAITGNDTICAGSTTQFCATPGMASYAWTGPGGFTASTACITIGTAGQYNVTITDGNGCYSNCSRTLIVNPNPTCAITGNDTICTGSTTQFCATPGMATYAWTGPGGFTASTACITIGTAGQYNVTITDGNGCYSNCSRTLIVNPNPICDIIGGNEICAGGSATFTVNGGPGATVTWTGPGGFTASGPTITVGVAGTYFATVISPSGCISHCDRTLIVHSNPVPSVPDVAQCAGLTATFCTTDLGAGFAYQWYLGINPIPGAQSFCYTTGVLTLADNGNVYKVVVTDNNFSTHCFGEDSGTLTVYPTPDITLRTLFVCPGGVIHLLSRVIALDPAIFNLPLSFIPAGTTFALFTGPDIAHLTPVLDPDNVTPPAHIWIRATGPLGGCADIKLLDIDLNAPPTCAITGNDTICAGGSSQFCATAGMASYSWTGPGGFTAVTQCITVTVAGAYTVTITDSVGCSSTCSRTLIVNPLPTCSITGNQTICTGGSSQFCATAGMTSYAWSGPGGFTATTACITVTTAGTYAVTITDANGCINSCSLPLNVQSCGEGCTPGYWQGGQIVTNGDSGIQKWDQASDAIPMRIKMLTGRDFYQAITFNSFFGTVQGVGCAPSNTLTLFQALDSNFKGKKNGCEMLFRAGVAAILNASSLAAYPLPPGVTSVEGLRQRIASAINSCNCAELTAILAANNELPHTNCGSITFNQFSKVVQDALNSSVRVAAYPNPFKNHLSFDITSDVSGNATLDIYNMLGQRVQNVFDGYIDAGMVRTVEYNNTVGAVGTYIYIFKVGDQTVTGKVINTDR